MLVSLTWDLKKNTDCESMGWIGVAQWRTQEFY
jgi:hypothetical protein